MNREGSVPSDKEEPVLTAELRSDLSVPDDAEGVKHILVNGENLDALELMNKEDSPLSLLETVDVCYIDPPYNTGNGESNGFVYNDNFRTSEDKHATWLRFMRERLTPLPALLRDTGIVIVSIDDSEVHHLRLLMDEIFGERNFMAQLVVDGGNPKNNARFFSITHEYMLVYAKNMTALLGSGIKYRKYRDGIDNLLKEYKKQKKVYGDDYEGLSAYLKSWVKTAPLSARLKVFYNADARGLYTYADLSTPGQGERYDVLHPLTGKPCKVPSRGWGMSKEKMEELIKDDMIIFGKDETFQPLKKHYLRKVKDQVQKGILEYSSRTSTHLLEKLLGRRASFNNPKNLQMMMDLIDLTCPEDGVVLDYFAGSGTTGHAILALNHKLGSSRKFVLVTNNENEIFKEVTYPRLMKNLETFNKSDAKKNKASGMDVFNLSLS